MKTIVLYYSSTGNNRFLAHKIAEGLGAACEEIIPRMNVPPLQILFSLLKKGPGIRAFGRPLNDYDQAVVMGPIWMGQLLYGLRCALAGCAAADLQLHFVTCCGGDETTAHDRFGYEALFRALKKQYGDRCKTTAAFSVKLVVPDDLKNDSDTIMKTRITAQNYGGELQNRIEAFIEQLQ
jgi:flavodoxin